MPKASLGEIYFVVGMMVLTLIITVVSIYFFVRTYKKEMREKEAAKRAKSESPDTAEKPQHGGGQDAA